MFKIWPSYKACCLSFFVTCRENRTKCCRTNKIPPIQNLLLDSATPLPIEVASPRMEAAGVNVLPLIHAVVKALPHSMRENFMAKVNLQYE